MRKELDEIKNLVFIYFGALGFCNPSMNDEILRDRDKVLNYLDNLGTIENVDPDEALDYLERIRDVLQNDKCIDIEWVFKHEYNTIKQALIQGEINKKFKEIVVSKCVGTENLTYVKIAEDYDDYLSLFEDKIEKEYLLFKDEFELLKEMFKDE